MKIHSQIIIDKVSAYYEKDKQSLINKCRKGELVKVRQITFKFLRDYTNLSLAQIGQFYGKDHATVLHSIKQVKNHYETESDFKHEIDELKLILRKSNKFQADNTVSFHYNVMGAFGKPGRQRGDDGRFKPGKLVYEQSLANN